MHIKISVHNHRSFTKHGRLKKHPQGSEVGFALVDVEPYRENTLPDFLKDTAEKLKKSYHSFSSPYVFTHIKAVNKETGEPVMIFEYVVRYGQEIMTSPTTLLRFLQS